MPFNGSGVYVPISSPDFPAVPATTIRAAQYNNEILDLAQALTNCVTRDGQSTVTADLPMGGFKHSNVAAAALRTQYARVAEVQDGGLTLLSSVTGTDTITATAPLGLAAYATGQVFRFVSAGANTGAVTLNINSLGAKAVTKLGAIALEAEDIPAGAVIEVFYDGVRFQLLTLVANVAATAKAGPNNSAFSFRNYIINGGGQIQQRGPMALSATANTSYCCDRITVQASGGTGLSGNATTTTANTRSGYYFGAINCSWTSATMKVQTRLPAEVTRPLNGRSMTISSSLTHTIGSTRSCQVVVQKANSADNFSAVTTLGTSSPFSAASGVTTPFSYTLALGASDATNGLLISVEDTAASTASTKTFAVSDFQVEEGIIATPFEVRPAGIELGLSLRYYFRTTPGASAYFGPGFAYATGQAIVMVPFPVEMRIAPVALQQSGTASDYQVVAAGSIVTCDAVPTYSSASKLAGVVSFYKSGGFTAGDGIMGYAANANAYLGWSAEL